MPASNDSNCPTSQLRRYGASVALIGAPALFIVQGLTEPKSSDDVRTQLGYVAHHAGGTRVSIVAGLIGSVLLIPALLFLVRLASDRMARVADIGGGLAIAGTVAFAALWGVDAVQLGIATSGIDTSQAVMATKAANATLPFKVILVLYMVGLTLGLLTLAVALWRSRAVPRLVVVAVVAFVVANVAQQATVGAAIMLAGLGWVAIKALPGERAPRSANLASSPH